MTTTDGTYAQWLAQAQVVERRLTAEQRGLLQAAFAFRRRCGDDYYSNRLLSHFLLHCDSGLKVAQIARLVGVSRPTASHQQGVSSKEAIQAAHHRLAGRPHGKLLPRYAGPIAEFILTHPDATRYDVLAFIQRTWGVHVSTVALYHFCKKFGLDCATRAAATAPKPAAEPAVAASAPGGGAAPRHPRRCRRPLFRRQDPVCGRVPVDAQSLGLVGHGPGLFRRRLRLLAPGPADQRLLLGGRLGTRLPPGRDDRRRLRPAVRRPPLPVALYRRRLAASLGLERGRCLLPPDVPVALDPRRRRDGQLRRAHHPALDEEVSHR